MASQRPLLQLDQIDASYSGVIQVLHGVSLRVLEGSVVALLGANGAGKSTALKAISNLLLTENGRITSGAVYFDDERIDGTDPSLSAGRGIAHVMEGRRLFPNLTVTENLRLGSYCRNNRAEILQDLDRVFAFFPSLTSRRHVRAGQLSGGEQQMVAMGRALMARPRLILLDEPSMGLAPIIVQEIFSIIRSLRASEGISIVLAEQNVAAALSLLDYGYVIENGSIAFEGSVDQLRANGDIANFYLGLGDVSDSASGHAARVG